MAADAGGKPPDQPSSFFRRGMFARDRASRLRTGRITISLAGPSYFGRMALGLSALLLADCASTATNAPPISPALLGAGQREHADFEMLSEGRSLLLNRCIQCHALPEAASFDSNRLRKIVATMSGRANLSLAEHEALLKYLLAVRTLQLAQ